MSNDLPANQRDDFFSDIREILRNARDHAAKAVNSAMVEAYWRVGERIVLEEQDGSAKAKYGERILEELSKNLTREFGRGFSLANLRNMRQFFLSCPEKGNRYTLSSELSWSHNCLIMSDKDETMVQYSVLKGNEQLFASKYRTVLPSEAELKAELERERRLRES